MKPLDRKMFRKPRATGRATGILASSAPLMTAAQKAMAQGKPLRAQRGASVSTTAMPNPGGPFFQNRILDYFSKTYDPSAKAPGSMIPGLLAAASPPIAFRQLMGTELGRPQDEVLLPANVRLSDDEPGLVTTNVRVPPVPPAGQGEKIAASAAARQDPSDTPTAGDPGAGRLSAEDELLIAAQGRGESAATEAAKDLLKSTKEAGGDVSAPTITPSAVTLPGGFDQTGAPDAGTKPAEQTDPKDALPDNLKGKRSPGKGVSATKETAEQNDKDLGISPVGPDGKPLTYKQRVQARFDVLKDLIGEDQAKDIRSDKSYNLMMLGLRIAAGQDPNALTNIARAGAEQLQEFGEVSGEESQRRAAKIENLTMLAASDVSEEIKAEAAREFAKSEREATQLFQAGEAQKGRDFQFDMDMFSKNFAALESSLNRQHDRAMRVLGEGYADRRAKNAADLQIAIRNANSQDQINLAVANYEFQADMAAQGRIFDLDKLILTQQFAKEQGIDDREFRAKLATLKGETQRLYEEYLTPEQVVNVLTTDKSKANRDKERGDFIEKFTTTQSSMDLVRDALVKKGVGEAEMPRAIAEFAAGLYDTHIWPIS